MEDELEYEEDDEDDEEADGLDEEDSDAVSGVRVCLVWGLIVYR